VMGVDLIGLVGGEGFRSSCLGAHGNYWVLGNGFSVIGSEYSE
jgi:hypothetical protein